MQRANHDPIRYTARMVIRLFPWTLSLAVSFVSVGCRKSSTASRSKSVDISVGTNKKTKSSIIRFEDCAASSGINYAYPKQPKPMRIIEAFGCGCAFLDYDADGWMDILLVASPHPLLYHNKGNGTLEDATASSGLDKMNDNWWTGVACGDYDGDGRIDLVFTGYRRLALLKNMDGKRFEDVTSRAGLDPHNNNHWGSSAGFMDLDGHGHLDLVLLNYVDFGPKEQQYCELRPGVRSGCPPQTYRPEFPELWRNVGNGKFKDSTDTSGVKNTHGKALALAFADVDGDGRMDFYIGNDGMPAELIHNVGGLHFKNAGIATGLAFGALQHPMAAMGADWADYDRDGRLDLAVSGFSDESYMLYRALGKGLFAQSSDASGIAGPTLKPLGFGTKWLDMDNDGWPDLSFVNGHVYDNAERIDPLTSYRQPLMLFHNKRGTQLVDLVPQMNGAVARPIVGRGSATGDFDNDGRTDLLVIDFEGAPLLLRNTSVTNNHWITLDLRGKTPNRYAYGARARAKTGEQVWVGQVSPASSYLSSSDPRVHFGLGSVAVLDEVTIQWSSGVKQVLSQVETDRIVRVEEGKGIIPMAVHMTK